MKHTKGPWTFNGKVEDLNPNKTDNYFGYSATIETATRVRFDVWGHLASPEEVEATAKLIAAAPELLKTIEKTYLQLQVVSNRNMGFALYTDSIRADLRNVISQVTGKSSQEVQEANEAEALKIK